MTDHADWEKGKRKEAMRRIHTKRWLAMLLAILFLPVYTGVKEGKKVSAEDAGGGWPVLNEAGYLDSGEFVHEDSENGIWRYCSETLKIEILRKTETKPVKLIWYEAEIWSREEVFSFVTNEPGEHFKYGTADWPEKVCRKNGAVLAINGDYASNRWGNMRHPKERYKVGILLRDGKIMSSETKKSGNTSFPNLDTLAIYPDGNMEVHDSRELTAEEYLERGATDVLAFGPWLIRGGEFNPHLPKFDTYRAPRTALGMIEPGHYIAFMAEGRHKQSKGCDLNRIAEKMRDRDCMLAFNLDGGETSCMVFMGKQINKVGSASSKKGYARKEPEFLAIGTSPLVDGYVP